eukprot:1767681-Rhodomonas_salina.1
MPVLLQQFVYSLRKQTVRLAVTVTSDAGVATDEPQAELELPVTWPATSPHSRPCRQAQSSGNSNTSYSMETLKTLI